MNPLLWTAALCLAVAAAWPASAQSSPRTGSIVDAIKQRGELRVGVSFFTPWAMRDADGGISGFEPDVARRLARDLGVRTRFVPMAFNDLVSGLERGASDVIISGLSRTPEREARVDFTAPYAHSGQHLVANRSRAGGFSLARFNRRGIMLVCRRGTAACETAYRRFPNASVLTVDTEAEALAALLEGRADGGISGSPLPEWWAGAHPAALFLPGGPPLVRTSEGFAIRKGDPEALALLNAWIRENTPWIAQAHRRWFSAPPDAFFFSAPSAP